MSLSWISQDLPHAFDSDRVANAFERWNALGDRPVFESLSDKIGEIASDPQKRAVLEALFGNSPYLTNLCLRDPDTVCDVFDNGLEQAFANALNPVNVSANARDLDQAATIAAVTDASVAGATITGFNSRAC